MGNYFIAISLILLLILGVIAIFLAGSSHDDSSMDNMKDEDM
ncbi:MAG: hypothetical protein P8163_11890 [Candidatus Thiodiazotropha sp.]